jgi:hypothetical protein
MPLMTADPPIYINSLRGFAAEISPEPSWVPEHVVAEAVEAGCIVVTEAWPATDGSEVPSITRGRPRKTAE